MATMSVQMKDDCGSYGYIKDKTVILNFLEKFGEEIGELKEQFYKEIKDGPREEGPMEEGGIYILDFLNNEFFSTNDTDNLSLSIFRLLGRLSKKNGERSPGFSLGQEGFSEEFYKELKKILDAVDDELYLTCTIIGGGDGYFDTRYELESDGWVVYADFYEDNEDEDW